MSGALRKRTFHLEKQLLPFSHLDMARPGTEAIHLEMRRPQNPTHLWKYKPKMQCILDTDISLEWEDVLICRFEEEEPKAEGYYYPEQREVTNQLPCWSPISFHESSQDTMKTYDSPTATAGTSGGGLEGGNPHSPPSPSAAHLPPHTSPLLHTSMQNQSQMKNLSKGFSKEFAVHEDEVLSLLGQPLSLDVHQIMRRFASAFRDTFCVSKKCHFDSLPESWPDEDRVVDGARSKWCSPLLLDALITFLNIDGFNLSHRRAFNQHKVLHECIYAELQASRPEVVDLLASRKALMRCNKSMSMQDADQDGHVQQQPYNQWFPFLQGVEEVEELSLLILHNVPQPWTDLTALRATMLSGPASKSHDKHVNIVNWLCGHPALQAYEMDIGRIFKVAVFKALFLYCSPPDQTLQLRHTVVRSPRNKRSCDMTEESLLLPPSVLTPEPVKSEAKSPSPPPRRPLHRLPSSGRRYGLRVKNDRNCRSEALNQNETEVALFQPIRSLSEAELLHLSSPFSPPSPSPSVETTCYNNHISSFKPRTLPSIKKEGDVLEEEERNPRKRARHDRKPRARPRPVTPSPVTSPLHFASLATSRALEESAIAHLQSCCQSESSCEDDSPVPTSFPRCEDWEILHSTLEHDFATFDGVSTSTSPAATVGGLNLDLWEWMDTHMHVTPIRRP